MEYGRNVNYLPLAFHTTGDFQLPAGTKATFDGAESYIRIDHQQQSKTFFATTDYAVSVWTVTYQHSQRHMHTSNYNAIVSKRGTEKDYGQDNEGTTR